MRLLLLFLVPLAAADVLDSIHSVLSYYRNREINDDFLFGVLLAQGQLDIIQASNGDLKDDVDLLLEEANKILKNNPRFYINDDTEDRVRTSLRLMKNIENKPITPQRIERWDDGFYHYGKPDRFNATFCNLEAMMADKITEMCLQEMADTRAKGYTLTSQALFYSLASSLLPFPFIQEKIQERCEKMYSDVDHAWNNGMPRGVRNLAIQEVAVCGLSKYPEFLTERMLSLLVDSQNRKGCFEQEKDDGCDEHLSAVTLVALTNFLYAQATQ